MKAAPAKERALLSSVRQVPETAKERALLSSVRQVPETAGWHLASLFFREEAYQWHILWAAGPGRFAFHPYNSGSLVPVQREEERKL